MKPVIGITGPDRGGEMAWLFTAASVLLSGGRPRRIRPGSPADIKDLDGLVLGGGADVDPQAYTEDEFIDQYLQQTIRDKKVNIFRRVGRMISWLYFPVIFILRKLFSRKSGTIDKKRDSLEFNLLDRAAQRNLPVLGICRGAQLINVYFKGDLYEDINRFYFEEPNRYSIFPVKTIYLKKGSQLARILEIDTLKVNALHRQAVKKTGENITINATEPNQVVQGIEHETQEFILGVQWHPEYLINRKRQRHIFKTLVQYSKKK
jgi:putative glutamine amidotransferase